MQLRTDLAAEAVIHAKDITTGGVSSRTTDNEQAQLEIQRIQILSEQASKELGKAPGKYITVKMTDAGMDNYSDMMKLRTQLIAEQIKELCPNASRILVAGLGNRLITPDAVGPLCAQTIFATRHIKELADQIDTDDLTELSVISPGVLGQTGIEASDIVKAICSSIGADTVIAVDALACAEIGSLGTTIQITDTGISPGSGVANSRKELSASTLGVKCIAIGVPTVIDFATNEKVPMMVTPRNVDRLVENAAEYVAMAINLAFQPSLSFEDIHSLV